MFVGIVSPLSDPEAGRNLTELTSLTGSVAVEHSRITVGSFNFWEAVIYELQGGDQNLEGIYFNFFCVWGETPQAVETQVRQVLRPINPPVVDPFAGFDRNGLLSLATDRSQIISSLVLALGGVSVEEDPPPKRPTKSFWDHILEED